MVLDRRKFIRNSAIAGLGLTFLPNLSFGNTSKQILNLAFIGVGLRGEEHLRNSLQRSDVHVKAICDLSTDRLKLAQELIKEAGEPAALEFGKDDYDYRNLLDLEEVDAVIISTPWVWHTPMSVDAMKAGKYTGVEVSAAMTMEEC